MSGRDGELARVIPFPGVRASAEASGFVAANPAAGQGASRSLVRAAGSPGVRMTPRADPRVAPRVTQRSARMVRPGRVRGCSSRTVRSDRVRLTRRGRIVVVVSALLAVGLAGLSGAALGSIGSEPLPERTSTVRVEPGETLWGIAQRVDADADVRDVVQRIGELNDLAEGEQLSPGQRLTVPSGR